MNACAWDNYLGPRPCLCDEIHPKAEEWRADGGARRGEAGRVVVGKKEQLKAFSVHAHTPSTFFALEGALSMVIFPWGLVGSLVDLLSFGLGRVEKDVGQRG